MADNDSTKKMFNMLIHEYLRKEGYSATAKAFQAEGSLGKYQETPDASILYRWFEAFNDICLLRSGKKKINDHLARIEGVMLKLENEKKRVSRSAFKTERTQGRYKINNSENNNIVDNMTSGRYNINKECFKDRFKEGNEFNEGDNYNGDNYNGGYNNGNNFNNSKNFNNEDYMQYKNYDYEDDDPVRFKDEQMYSMGYEKNYENVSEFEQLTDRPELYKSNNTTCNLNMRTNSQYNDNRYKDNSQYKNNRYKDNSQYNNNNNNNNIHNNYHINYNIIQGHPNPNYQRPTNYSFSEPANYTSQQVENSSVPYRQLEYTHYGTFNNRRYPNNGFSTNAIPNTRFEGTSRKSQSVDERIPPVNNFENSRVIDYNASNSYHDRQYFEQNQEGHYYDQNRYPKYRGNYQAYQSNPYQFEQNTANHDALDPYKRDHKKLNFVLQREFDCGNQKSNFIVFSRRLGVMVTAGSDKSLGLIDFDTNGVVLRHVVFENPITNLAINEVADMNSKMDMPGADPYKVDGYRGDVLIAVCSIDDMPRIFRVCKNPLSLSFVAQLQADGGATMATFGKNCVYTINTDDEIEKYALDGNLIAKIKMDVDLRKIMWIKENILLLIDVNKTFYLDFDTKECVDILPEPVSLIRRCDNFFAMTINEEVHIYDLAFKRLNIISLTERPHSIDIIDDDNIFVGTYKYIFWCNMTNMVSFKAHDNVVGNIKVIDPEKYVVASSSLTGGVKVWCVE